MKKLKKNPTFPLKFTQNSQSINFFIIQGWIVQSLIDLS